MSCILYYSLPSCSAFIQKLVASFDLTRQIHFVCVDNKVMGSNQVEYIVLAPDNYLIYPNGITQIPALLTIVAPTNIYYGEQSIVQFISKNFRATTPFTTSTPASLTPSQPSLTFAPHNNDNYVAFQPMETRTVNKGDAIFGENKKDEVEMKAKEMAESRSMDLNIHPRMHI